MEQRQGKGVEAGRGCSQYIIASNAMSMLVKTVTYGTQLESLAGGAA